MKLITYRFRGAEHVGALTGDGAMWRRSPLRI